MSKALSEKHKPYCPSYSTAMIACAIDILVKSTVVDTTYYIFISSNCNWQLHKSYICTHKAPGWSAVQKHMTSYALFLKYNRFQLLLSKIFTLITMGFYSDDYSFTGKIALSFFLKQNVRYAWKFFWRGWGLFSKFFDFLTKDFSIISFRPLLGTASQPFVPFLSYTLLRIS